MRKDSLEAAGSLIVCEEIVKIDAQYLDFGQLSSILVLKAGVEWAWLTGVVGLKQKNQR